MMRLDHILRHHDITSFLVSTILLVKQQLHHLLIHEGAGLLMPWNSVTLANLIVVLHHGSSYRPIILHLVSHFCIVALATLEMRFDLDVIVAH